MSSQEPSDRGSSTDEEMQDAQDRIRREGLAQQSPPSTPPRISNRRQQGSLNRSARLEPVQRLIGVTQWENSEQLSDVVIRFGQGPKDIFHGHKVILSSWSFWFRNAFMNPNWREANSKEVVLHGDEPTALHLMLRALYLPENKYHIAEPWLDREAADDAEVTLSKRAVFSVSVWQVADKYDCPTVKYWVCTYTVFYLNKALDWARNHARDPNLLRLTGLEAIVQAVYNVTGHRLADNEPLRGALLNALISHPTTTPYGEQCLLRAETWRIAQAVPQFGADMFVVTTQIPSYLPVVSRMQINEKAICPSCNAQVWFAKYTTNGRCDNCGGQRNDWQSHVVRRLLPAVLAPQAPLVQ